MGASAWRYVVPYREDLAVVLADLHRQVLAAHDYVLDLSWDEAWPATVEEALAHPSAAFDGTHSILDLNRIVVADAPDEHGTLRWLRPEELLHYFGTVTPAGPAVDALADELETHGQSQSGYAVTTYDEAGAAQNIVVWGFSGD